MRVSVGQGHRRGCTPRVGEQGSRHADFRSKVHIGRNDMNGEQENTMQPAQPTVAAQVEQFVETTKADVKKEWNKDVKKAKKFVAKVKKQAKAGAKKAKASAKKFVANVKKQAKAGAKKAPAKKPAKKAPAKKPVKKAGKKK